MILPGDQSIEAYLCALPYEVHSARGLSGTQRRIGVTSSRISLAGRRFSKSTNPYHQSPVQIYYIHLSFLRCSWKSGHSAIPPHHIASQETQPKAIHCTQKRPGVGPTYCYYYRIADSNKNNKNPFGSISSPLLSLHATIPSCRRMDASSGSHVRGRCSTGLWPAEGDLFCGEVWVPKAQVCPLGKTTILEHCPAATRPPALSWARGGWARPAAGAAKPPLGAMNH